MTSSRLLVLTAAGLVAALLGGDVFAECGGYRPPPPPPPPPPPLGDVPEDSREPRDPPPPDRDGPTTPGVDIGGPTTGGGVGDDPGPTTGPGRAAGPTTGNGAGGSPTTGSLGPRGPGTGGPRRGGNDDGNWTHWWYANRPFLLPEGTRVGSRAALTGEAVRDDSLWRAEVRRALAEALGDDDDEVIAAAVLALGKGGDAADIPLVRRVALDEKLGQAPRESAAMALGLLGSQTIDDAKEALAALRGLAEDTELPTRFRAIAVYSLGLRQDEGALPFLADVARSGGRAADFPVAGVTALGLSGSLDARQELERLLAPSKRGSDTTRRVYAAHGLAKLGDPACLPALIEALADEEKDVRRAAALAIGAVAADVHADAVAALEKAVRDDRDRMTRAMAAVALGRVAAAESAATLRYVYDRDDASVRPFAAVALGVLARRRGEPRIAQDLLRDLKRGTRMELLGATCVAVGLAGLTDAAPALRKLVTESKNHDVIAQAAVSLGLLGDRDVATDILRKVLLDSRDPMLRGEVALALGMLGDARTLMALDNMVQDGGSEHERITGLLALGRIGGPESASLLTGVLRDTKRSDLERHMAGNALGMLLDTSEGRAVGRVCADLNWFRITPTVFEIQSEF